MSDMKENKGFKKVAMEYAEAIVTALILALFIRAFVVQAFKIPTGSMIPTLLVGDHLLVNKFIYGTQMPFAKGKVMVFKNPAKGDIIVFKYPEDPKRDFIKRVVGVGGDVVEGRDKVVYINGQPENNPHVIFRDDSIKPRGPDPRDNFGPIKVPEGKLFVMGDNRDQSYDSRYWGFVDLWAVKGKAFVLYWSWDGEKNVPRINRMFNIVR